jgi:hypothetical protein
MLSITTGGTAAELEVDSAHTGTVEQFLKPRDGCGGVVEAVGAEVTRFHVGDAVFGASSRTFAEFTCAREDQLCAKAERLSVEQAAASTISGPPGSGRRKESRSWASLP